MEYYFLQFWICISNSIQLYFQTQGPLTKNRQYKPKQYTLIKTVMPIFPHRGWISHFSKPRICQQHYNFIMWIVQPTNFSLKQGMIVLLPYRINHLHCTILWVFSAGSSYKSLYTTWSLHRLFLKGVIWCDFKFYFLFGVLQAVHA